MLRLFKWINISAVLFIITVEISTWILFQKIALPEQQPVKETVWLAQNWTDAQQQEFYYTHQGTFLSPYSWFLALEQPKISWFGAAPRFSDPEYLTRFGFLVDRRIAAVSDTQKRLNPDGLPVGFAKYDAFKNPINGDEYSVVGLTCAVCHTGQINYKGIGIRINGGPPMLDIIKFQTAFEFAIGLTYFDPLRYRRFERNVLGAEPSDEARATLKRQLWGLVEHGLHMKKYEFALDLYPTEEGFGRLDALGRIGNFAFGFEMNEDNLRVADAPVNYPPLWDASWFDWVQYNASVKQPMTRNAGEALGVFALINLVGPKEQLFDATLHAKNLYELEIWLAGDKPFSGLQSPAWPETILGALDKHKIRQGKALYRNHCKHCHPPSVKPQDIKDRWTAPNQWGKSFLKLDVINIKQIGTDPNMAMNWYSRTVDTGDRIIKAAQALPWVVTQAIAKKYQAMNLSAAEQARYNGYRNPEVRSPLGYKARPLNGVWATAPYLHNGAVPNLYQLLGPASQRDKTFYLGSREFDPIHVGYETGAFNNGFELDTRLSGNANSGHEYRELTEEERATKEQFGFGYPFNGVMGPPFNEAQREALIEYLKSL